MKCAVLLDAVCIYGRANDVAASGGNPMACKPRIAASGGEKDERKAAQLAET